MRATKKWSNLERSVDQTTHLVPPWSDAEMAHPELEVPARAVELYEMNSF